MAHATRAAVTLSPVETAVVHLLNTAPERWGSFDRDQLTAAETEALTLLNSIGMVEIRSRKTMHMIGHSAFIQYTLTSYGEVFPDDDLRRASILLSLDEWKGVHTGEQQSETVGRRPFCDEIIGPEQWRMTASGVGTRDAMRGKPLVTVKREIGGYSSPSRPRTEGRFVVSEALAMTTPSLVEPGMSDGRTGVGAESPSTITDAFPTPPLGKGYYLHVLRLVVQGSKPADIKTAFTKNTDAILVAGVRADIEKQPDKPDSQRPGKRVVRTAVRDAIPTAIKWANREIKSWSEANPGRDIRDMLAVLK